LNPGDSANPNTTKKSLFFCKDITCNRLILDELGFLPIDKRGSDLLFQVASARYETGAMVITTNRPPNEWDKIFNNDTTLAAALADRVLHHGEVVVIEGQSYRVKNNQSQS
jgi:DNA replication protein DnaC